ncbi:MAG: hypothetical protein OEW98_10030 [Betaproteobacteria bacterium]|jgi:glutathione S-transferase|nr:hypothetical protein [Betaproteobacteria bacterium]
MAEHVLHCLAQSGTACKPALALAAADLSLGGHLFFDDGIGIDWTVYAAIRDWLDRIRSEPRRARPRTLMPGHPLPNAS